MCAYYFPNSFSREHVTETITLWHNLLFSVPYIPWNFNLYIGRKEK